MYSSSKFLKITSLCLAIFPACFVGILIAIYSINFPYWDQWGIAPLFEKVHNGSLSFSDLIAQHNESRKFFPRLIFISLGYLTHWDVRYEMIVVLLLACLVSLNVYYLSKLTVGGSTIKILSIAAISNLLIFSPVQSDSWVWGIQVAVFIPIACITTCISVAYSRLGTKTKFLICICLSTISTFSYSNGILAWLVVFTVLVLKSRGVLTKNRWLIFAWIASFLANVVVYFYNYKKPPHHPSFLAGTAYPLQAVQYFLSFLGAPLSFGNGISALIAAPIIGLILSLLFLASCLYLFFSRDFALLQRMAAWLTLAMYPAISAIITTLGRVGFGVEQALSPRYTTFSVYFTVSMVYLIAIITDDINRKNYKVKIKNNINQFTYFSTIAILVLHLLTSIYAIRIISITRVERLQGKSCLLFINFIQDECLTQKVYPNADHLKHFATSIDNLGFLTPSLIRSSIIEDIEGKTFNSENYGAFETLTQVSKNVYLASGWAILTERGEPSDSVILTYENDNKDSILFAIVDRRSERNDVAKALNNSSYSNSGWQKTFSSTGFPKGVRKISAWAFNANTGKAFKLNGTHIIQTDSSASVAIPGIKNIQEINFQVASNSANGFFNGTPGDFGGVKLEVPKATPFYVSGWAILSNDNRPADMVIITSGDTNSLVAVVPVNLARPDVAKNLKNSVYENSGWSTMIAPSTLADNRVILKGWAYNSTTKQATQLNNSLEVIVLE